MYWRRRLPSIRSREAPRGGTANRTGRSEGHCAHRAIVLPRRSREQSNAQNEGFDDFRGNGGTGDTGSVNATTAIVKARVRHNNGKSSSYLVVRPRDTDRTPLGQDGIARPLRHARIRCEGSCSVLRQAWRPLLSAAITTCGCEVTPERAQPLTGALQCRNGARLRAKPRGVNPAGSLLMHQRERSTRLCGPQAPLRARCPRNSERAETELFKRADTAAQLKRHR